MNNEEAAFAAEIYQAIQDASNYSDRSLQAKDFRLGISDIGYCPERNRRLLDQQDRDDTDALPAFIGTAIGDHAERALARAWPHAIIQSEVVLQLRLQDRSINLPGHPDIVVPGWGVWDGKTDYGLGTVERDGPSFSQQWQRNAYALAAWQMGVLGNIALEDVKVGNFWIDRAAIDRRVHVNITSFDPEVIELGVQEIDSTVYAFVNNEEAEKRPPRQVCKTTCGFYRKCREWETDVHGLIDDPELVGHVFAYVRGSELAREGAKLQKEAKVHLAGISGSTGEHLLRWTWINENENRRGYYKISVEPVMGADA